MMVAIDTLAWLEDEARELNRLEANMVGMIQSHRRSVMKVLNEMPDRTGVQKAIEILGITDFKGYYRDRAG